MSTTKRLDALSTTSTQEELSQLLTKLFKNMKMKVTKDQISYMVDIINRELIESQFEAGQCFAEVELKIKLMKAIEGFING